MVEVTAGYLSRRSPICRQHEYMGIAHIEIAAAIRTIVQLINYSDTWCPISTFRLGRRRRQSQALAFHQGRKRDVLTVWRPTQSTRRILQVAQQCGLPCIHPAYIQFWSSALSTGHISQAGTIRCPAGTGIGICSRQQWPLIRAISIYNPDIGPGRVAHDVIGIAHIGNLRPIG